MNTQKEIKEKLFLIVQPKSGSGKTFLATTSPKHIVTGDMVCSLDDDTFFSKIIDFNEEENRIIIELPAIDGESQRGEVKVGEVMKIWGEVSEKKLQKGIVNAGDTFHHSEFKCEHYTRRPDEGEVLTAIMEDERGLVKIGDKVTVVDTFSSMVTISTSDGQQTKMYEHKFAELHYTTIYFLCKCCEMSYV